MIKRCEWCSTDPLYMSYHDEEWGVPVYDDQMLIECLLLEGAQAGLSWITVLKKRENYRQAFENYDCEKLSRFTEQDVERLMQNPGIIRHRLKIQSVIKNARGILAIQQEFGSLSSYLWAYVDGKTIQNNWTTTGEIPVKTKQSEAMSKDLKKRGFNFVGPTICYAFMQAVGMVNDHTSDCFRHRQVRDLIP